MKKILAKPKTLHHKYKRYAAALAGAAIMAGTTLGIPVSKAAAAEAPVTSPPSTIEQSTMANKDHQPPAKQIIANKTDPIKRLKNRLDNGWHEHLNEWPSPGDNQAWYEDGRIYYLNAKDPSAEYNNTLSTPVQLVKEYASLYGFDPNNDVFTLLSQSNREATVQIVKHDTGQRFTVDLENRQDWRIVAIRGVGDTNHPATYQSTRTFSPY